MSFVNTDEIIIPPDAPEIPVTELDRKGAWGIVLDREDQEPYRNALVHRQGGDLFVFDGYGVAHIPVPDTEWPDLIVQPVPPVTMYFVPA